MNFDRVERLDDVVRRHREERIREHQERRDASSLRTSTMGDSSRCRDMGHSLSDAEPEVNCASSMLARLRRFLDVRPGEGLPVLLSFLYIGGRRRLVPARQADPERPVSAAIRAVRAGLRLRRGARWCCRCSCRSTPRVAARFGARTGHHRHADVLQPQRPRVLGTRSGSTRSTLLPAIFYVWVNCFGVIAPVQAWSFANSLFDTRQAKRLFGLIGVRRLARRHRRRVPGARPGRAGRRRRQPAAGARGCSSSRRPASSLSRT